MNEKIKQIAAELMELTARMGELQHELQNIARRVDQLSAQPQPQPQPQPEPEPEPEPEPVDIHKPIRLPISDRFLFQRELFGGDAELMASVLRQIEQMDSFSEAKTYLVDTLGLNPDTDSAKIFIASIARHFDPRSTLLA